MKRTTTSSVLASWGDWPRRAYRRGRRRWRQVVGLDPVHTPDLDCPAVYLGSDYGGWTIHTNPLDSDSVVYSFGVGTDISFDRALIDRFQTVVHAFDPTPRSAAWVRAQVLPPAFVFHDFGVADFDGLATFYPPADAKHVSYSIVARDDSAAASVQGAVFRLDTIMRKLGHDHIDVLKMDIEGSEYAVIDSLLENRVSVGQLLVEFHHRLPGVGANKTAQAVQRLRRRGFKLFSISETGEEYSFLHC